MAFSETDKLRICRVLQIDMIRFNLQINYYAAYMTTEVETQVGQLLSKWFDDGSGDDFVSVEPNTANFGARIDPELVRENIRQEICSLMLFGDDIGGSADSFEIRRG